MKGRFEMNERTKTFDDDPRLFQCRNLKLDIYNTGHLLDNLRPYDFKMFIALGTVLRLNTNIVLNRVGDPAKNRAEILTAMGYTQGASTPITSLKHLFNLDIVRRVKDKSYFGGVYYMVNPYVMQYGNSMKDESKAIFDDTIYKRVNDNEGK